MLGWDGCRGVMFPAPLEQKVELDRVEELAGLESTALLGGWNAFPSLSVDSAFSAFSGVVAAVGSSI